MLFSREIVLNLRKELMRNIRKDVLNELKREKQKNSNTNIVEKIKHDLARTLERRGIDISNMQIYFKPDISNVTVCIRGD